MRSTRGLADPTIKARLIWAALQCRSRPLNFRKVIGDETEKWAKVVKFSRAKPD